MYTIHLMPASFGDSILIEYGSSKKHYILIDGGPFYAYEGILQYIKTHVPDLVEIELLVVTHVDIDHIDGIVVLLNQNKLPFLIRDIWFNGFAQMQEKSDILGSLQGEYLSTLIKKKKLPQNKHFNSHAVVIKEENKLPVITLQGGMEITLLNPYQIGLQKMLPVWSKELEKFKDEKTFKQRLKEDYRYDDLGNDLLGSSAIEQLQKEEVKGDTSEANGSSIAFLASYENKHGLFAADAHTKYLEKSVQTLLKQQGKSVLNIDAWKLAHHGSKKSTLDTIMPIIQAKKILISSDGKKFKHPDQETIAKLLKHNSKPMSLYFNYKTEYNQMWDESAKKEKYSYQAFYPQQEEGIKIEL
jgi:beta-lactamase superfamily II metal-dependent hydrolase